MSKLLEPTTERPICRTCGQRVVMFHQYRKDGSKNYRTECTTCHRKRYGMENGGDKSFELRKAYLEDACERCGFIPERLCQLDIHHIDSDRGNDSPTNLQTLCANCHRLATYKDAKRTVEQFRG